jgi:hypothetical protein
MNLGTGWKGVAGSIGMMLVGAVLIWYSTQPGVPVTAQPILLSAGLALIPAGLAALGVRDAQSRLETKLEQANVIAPGPPEKPADVVKPPPP